MQYTLLTKDWYLTHYGNTDVKYEATVMPRSSQDEVWSLNDTPSEASSSEVKAAVESACLVLFLCLLSLPYAPLVV